MTSPEVVNHPGTSSEVGLAGHLFENCLELLAELLKTARRLGVLSGDQDRQLYKQLEGFLLWGDGFNPAQGELDKTLSHSAGLNTLVLQLLSAFGPTLLRRLPIVVKRPPDRKGFLEKQAPLVGLLENVTNTIPTNNMYDPHDSDSDAEDPNKGLSDTIESLATYVSCLLDTVPALEIVKESIDRGEILATDGASQVVFSVPEEARPYCRNIANKFPKAALDLVERLGEANWERHKRLREDLERASSATVEESYEVEVAMPHDFAPRPPAGTVPSLAASLTTDALFLTADTDGESGSVQVPSPPKEALVGKPFRCKICGRLKKLNSRIDWRRHVFEDLRPYICTFGACQYRLSTFATRKAWWTHEFSAHRMEKIWTCPTCKTDVKRKDGFEGHLNADHSAILDRLGIEAAAAAAEEAAVWVLEDPLCPLCLDTAGNTALKCTSHIGRHMEEISLIALSQELDSDPEADQSRNESAVQQGAITGEGVSENLTDRLAGIIEDLDKLTAQPLEEEPTSLRGEAPERSPPTKPVDESKELSGYGASAEEATARPNATAESFAPRKTRPKVGPLTLWQCEACGTASQSVRYDLRCMRCQHDQCGYCAFY